MRSGPGDHFSEVTTLTRGKKVKVAGEENGWLKIISKLDRPPGYIPASAVQPVALAQSGNEPRSTTEPEGTSTYVTTESVTVRSGPGEHFSPAGAIASGKEINVAGEEDGWLKVISKRGRAPGYIPATAARSTALAQGSGQYRPPPEHPQEPPQPVVDQKRRRRTQAAVPEPAPEQPQESEIEVLPPPRPGLLEVYRKKGGSGGYAESCDAYAAHAADPQRNGSPGVEDDNIPTDQAIPECTKAVEQDPQNSRLLFQLGRSYWVAGQYEEAIERFIAAGELGHGGALAYLGDATLYGVAEIESDPEEARKLYQRAADAGFAPAAATASEIVAGVKAEKQSEQQASRGAVEYHHPTIITALAQGKVISERMEEKLHFTYMGKLIQGAKHHCPEVISSEKDFALQAGAEALRRFGLDAVFGGRPNAYNTISQEGLDDGYAFVYSKGCNSRETQVFTNTIFRFVGYSE